MSLFRPTSKELFEILVKEGKPIRLGTYPLEDRTFKCWEYGWAVQKKLALRPVKPRKSKRHAGKLLPKGVK